MHFTLSAVGRELTVPIVAGVEGKFEDAVRIAEGILEREPACESVEIFAEGHFLRDIARRLD